MPKKVLLLKKLKNTEIAQLCLWAFIRQEQHLADEVMEHLQMWKVNFADKQAVVSKMYNLTG